MMTCGAPRLVLLVLTALTLCANDAFGAILYRVGTPFTPAQQDSLGDLGIEFREIDWSFSAVEQGLELDSLSVGSLQPNYLEEDEDLAPTASTRGGWISVTVWGMENPLFGEVLVDGDPTTAYMWKEVTGLGASPIRVTIDLGGQFLVKQLRFRPTPEYSGRFVESFRIGAGDALRKTSCGKCIGNLPSVNVQKPGGSLGGVISENTDPDVTVLVEPPDGLHTRFLQLQVQRVTGKAIELAEFEVFGGGFVNQASYVSDIIELETVGSWGAITWSGRRDPEAQIDIRTRTGADRQPDVFWEARPEQQDIVRFLDGGGTMTARDYIAAYGRLPDVFKPVDEPDRMSPDTENWSFWSAPYDFEGPGLDVVSSGSRQFIQLRADFSSTALHAGKLEYLEFKASAPPAVRGVVGEIFPPLTHIGEVTHFTYFVKPTIRAGDQGFDSVEISTPSGFSSVDSLRLEGVDQAEFTWTPKPGNLGFEVRLPRRLEATDSGAVLEVVFNAPVLREVGSSFDGRVFDSTRPHEVRQQITPGNAADEVESDLLSVRTSMSRSLLFKPRANPAPFTPNGDGINDQVAISYTLLRVTAPVAVSVAIHDLSGGLVKEVYRGDDPVGEHARLWDGTDTGNRLVAPGLYLYRIEADLHTEAEVESGIIPVAY